MSTGATDASLYYEADVPSAFGGLLGQPTIVSVAVFTSLHVRSTDAQPTRHVVRRYYIHVVPSSQIGYFLFHVPILSAMEQNLPVNSHVRSSNK